MALFATLKAYQALTPEQKAFLRSKQIEDALPIEGWYTFLAPLEAYDRYGDKAQKMAGAVAIIAPIGVIFSLIFELFFSVGLLLIVVFAAALTIYLTLRKNNVPDLLREFLVPLLAVLRQDVPAREPLHLDLDLTGLTDVKQTEPPPHARGHARPSGYPKIRETYYADPWLYGNTQFIDGTRIKWEITDRVRERKITKRNPRGKIKTKYKYKTKRRIDVRLQAPAAHYTLDSNEGGGDVMIRVKPGTKRNAVSARQALITKVTGSYTPPHLAVQPFLDTVAHAYRNLTPTATTS